MMPVLRTMMKPAQNGNCWSLGKVATIFEAQGTLGVPIVALGHMIGQKLWQIRCFDSSYTCWKYEKTVLKGQKSLGLRCVGWGRDSQIYEGDKGVLGCQQGRGGGDFCKNAMTECGFACQQKQTKPKRKKSRLVLPGKIKKSMVKRWRVENFQQDRVWEGVRNLLHVR